MDLLEYAQQLVNQGNTTSQVQAHRVYLQELVSQEPQKVEIKPTTIKNNQAPAKNSNHTYLLIGGLVLFGLAVLAIGY
jgi:CHASE3 domain sensor protein